jgi:ParB-like chromosome segregation protein Spo0J
MQIDSVDIDLLIPDPDNANTHDEKNLKAIRGSIKKFGMVEPLVVRRQNNVVIGGNGRLAVLKELGHAEAPVHYVDLDDQKAKALGIALNRTSELSKFDTDVLMKQLKELQDSDFDIGDIGFDAEDIKFDVPPV